MTKPEESTQPQVEDVQKLFDRLEEDGVAITSVSDGFIFAFTTGTLERLLSDAEASPHKKAIVFVRSPAKGVS
jgi:hypothetical protein